MRTIRLPEKVSDIITTLQEAGYEAYAVGGCVRDSLLEKTPHDWDITTSALPEQTKALFRRTVDTGIAHGTVTVLFGKDAYEVTTYRIDGDYSDRRHPDHVTFTESLKEDLRRRDFTINAMAYSKRDGIVDLFGGMEDLENGIVRAVGDPAERFTEDALRILRAIRFSAQLDFSVEEKTYAAAEALSQTLEEISAERIREELLKILLSDHPEKLLLCYETGMTAVFLPEFDAMMQTPQNTPHHCYDVGTHTIESIKRIRADRVLRLAMLFHDTGKPDSRTTDANGRDHFYGHQVKSAEITERALRRLKFDNDTIRKVVRLVRWHDEKPDLTEEAVRHAIVMCGIEAFPDLFLVKEADILAQSEYRRQEKLDLIRSFEKLYETILQRGDCLSVKDLAVDGTDLMAAGVKAGPAVGETLQKLLDRVLTDPSLNTKERLMEIVEKL